MKLYVMRHGPAEDQSRSGRDFDRKLTSSGRTRTERVARELERQGEVPKRIVTSPLVRTLETAEVVIATLHLSLEAEPHDELVPGGHALAVVRRLAADGARRVMLVGHEPDVSRLTAHLVPDWSQGFDKAMIVGLDVDRDALADSKREKAAELRFVIEPKHIDN